MVTNEASMHPPHYLNNIPHTSQWMLNEIIHNFANWTLCFLLVNLKNNGDVCAVYININGKHVVVCPILFPVCEHPYQPNKALPIINNGAINLSMLMYTLIINITHDCKLYAPSITSWLWWRLTGRKGHGEVLGEKVSAKLPFRYKGMDLKQAQKQAWDKRSKLVSFSGTGHHAICTLFAAIPLFASVTVVGTCSLGMTVSALLWQ